MVQATEGMKGKMVKELGSEIGHPWVKLDASEKGSQSPASSLRIY